MSKWPADSLTKLERLHRAAVIVAGAHDVDTALQAIIDSARLIADAEMAALGVPGDPDEPMDRFITSGLSPERIQQAGTPPMGHGVLGVLLRDGKPMRLDNVRDHPAFQGYDDSRHPLIRSFLGVPIRAGGETIGDLYLANKAGDKSFSEEDQRLIEMLAAHAAVVIQNLRYQAQASRMAVLHAREKFARSVEDDVLQQMFGCGLLLDSMDLQNPEKTAWHIAEVQKRLDTAIERLRTHLTELASPPLENSRA